MMKKVILLTFLLSLLLTAFGNAQQESGIEVEEMVFCSGVENRQPVGVTSQFLNPIERVYCFTKIVGAVDTITVEHVWYFGDEEKARVELSVKSGSWRTWSSKRMLVEWSDVWRVDVVSPDGKVLSSSEFIYKPLAE
jgi:hypothetical protein